MSACMHHVFALFHVSRPAANARSNSAVAFSSPPLASINFWTSMPNQPLCRSGRRPSFSRTATRRDGSSEPPPLANGSSSSLAGEARGGPVDSASMPSNVACNWRRTSSPAPSPSSAPAPAPLGSTPFALRLGAAFVVTAQHLLSGQGKAGYLLDLERVLSVQRRSCTYQAPSTSYLVNKSFCSSDSIHSSTSF